MDEPPSPTASDTSRPALRSHNIEAIVVDTGDEAKDVVLGMIPEGAEVHSGKSKTLEDIGLYAEFVESGRFDAIRPRLVAMDRATQGREIPKLVAAPDFMLGSVAAITDDGTLVAASATGQPARRLRVGRRTADPRHRQSEARPGPRRSHATDPTRSSSHRRTRGSGAGWASTRGSRRS